MLLSDGNLCRLERVLRHMTQILAISGSLRARSINTELLKAAALLSPPNGEILLLNGLADVPAFSPDHDVDPAPDAVASLRAQFAAADAFLFCTPEYAHGVPGALKNALDWLVGSGETSQKPFAVWNASPPAEYAVASLTETVMTMDALLVPAACLSLSLRGKTLDAASLASDPKIAARLQSAVASLIDAVTGQALGSGLSRV